jgi:hypothetical protein
MISIEEKQKRSSGRLQREVKEAVTKFFETVLDFSEVAIGDEKRYKALRSKVLRHGNDTIRRIISNIESNYVVTHDNAEIEVHEEIVRFTGKKKE